MWKMMENLGVDGTRFSRDPVFEDGVFHLTFVFREKRGVTQTC